jgi:hypothetical protein
LWRPFGPSSFDSQVELLMIESFSASVVKNHKSRGKLPPIALPKLFGYGLVAPFCSAGQIAPGLAPSGDSVLRS